MTPRVTLILKRAFSLLAEKIATTWRWEFREGECIWSAQSHFRRLSKIILLTKTTFVLEMAARKQVNERHHCIGLIAPALLFLVAIKT